MLPADISPQEVSCDRGFERIVFAEDQPEYLPLPALSNGHSVITKWKLTDEDIKYIFQTREIYLKVLTFGHPLQPVKLSTKIEEL